MKIPKPMLAVGVFLVATLSLALVLPTGSVFGILDLTAERLEPAPELRLASPSEGDGVGASVRIAGEAVSSAREVIDVQYRVDSGRWESAPVAARGQRSTPFEIDVDLGPGDHVLEVRASDGGSFSLPSRVLVRRDAPTLQVLQPVDGDGVESGPVVFAGTVLGIADSVLLEIGEHEIYVPVIAGAWRVTVELPVGVQEVRASALGAKHSLPRVLQLAVGSPAPPTLTILTPRADATYGQAGDLACGGGCILVSGSAIRAVRVAATLDGVPTSGATVIASGWTLRIPMATLANGTHELVLRPYDRDDKPGIARSVRFLAHTATPLTMSGDPRPTATGTVLSFEAIGNEAESANWTLDGEALAQGRAIEFVLATPGDHVLSVQTGGPRGRAASASLPLYALNRPPTLSFLGEPVSLAGEYRFSVQASDPDGIVRRYQWDLGDGAVRTTREPVILHRYLERGTYDVTATVFDDQGASTALSTTLVVTNAAPEANFSWSPAEPTVFDVITLRDTSVDHDGVLAQRLWRFADGNVSEDAAPSLRLRTRGLHNISLRVVDDLGLATDIVRAIKVYDIPPTPAFAFEPALPLTHEEIVFGDLSHDPDGPIVSYAWDLGDNTTAEGAAVLHAYRRPGTYQVLLTIVDDAGLSANLTRDVVVGDSRPQVRAVTVEPPTPFAHEAAQFRVVADDRDGGLIGASWDFGDGVKSNDTEPTHRYARSGLHAGNVTVYDETGLSATFPFFVPVLNALPSVGIEIGRDGGRAAYPTVLLANASDPDGRIVFYRFDADGDGNLDCESTEPSCSFVYEQATVYGATLTVEDDEGGTASTQRLVEIILSPPGHPPPALRVESPLPGATLRGEQLFRGTTASPRNVTQIDFQMRTAAFSYSGSRDPWRLLPGTTAWQQIIDTRAFTDGDYDLVMRVADDAGGVGTHRIPVKIQNGPRASEVTLQLIDPPSVIDNDVGIRGSAFHPEGVTSVRWRIDGESWTAETENPLAFILDIDRDRLKPGEHVLRVEAYHGITQMSATTHVFNVPGTRPVLVVDDPPNAIAHALLHAEGRIVGLGRAQWRLDQGVWQDLPPGPSWTLHTDTLDYSGGRHTLTLRAISPDGRLTSDIATYKVEIINPPFQSTGNDPAASPTPRADVPAAPWSAAVALLAVALFLRKRH